MDKPLLGRIVDIQGMNGIPVNDSSDGHKLVRVNGQRGQVLCWQDDKECYLVHTFEGMTVSIPERHLVEAEAEALSPEMGGCDLVYPIGGSAEVFGKDLAFHLSDKGYCVVQMSESQQTRVEAIEVVEGDGEPMQDIFRHETESAYLGSRNITQVRALPQEEDDDLGNALTTLKKQMDASFKVLSEHTEEYLGHACWGATSIWARVSDGSENIDDAAPMNEKDVHGNYIQAYERFVEGRKTCAMYFVDNDGGEVQLCPRIGSDLAACGMEEIKVPISPNKMLIFRHDQLSYTYHPTGPSLALQSWMLSDIPMAQQNLKVAELSGVKEAPPGDNAQIMMLDTRHPGSAVGALKFWSMFAAGTDTDCHWPVTRWETEPYYTDGPDAAQVGKAYTCHGGFMNEEDMLSFDNLHFGIDDKEAGVLCPNQRHWLEVGYGCLYKSGYTAESLKGENIGVFLGDVGMDWHAYATPWVLQWHGTTDITTLSQSIHVGITASRLSHIYDMRGPIKTYDTACSASLVALQAGHKQLMHYGTDTNKEASISAPHSCLAGGLNVLMHPMSYVGNCAAGMLSHVGRCWTFDRTADGYQRGEGTGGMFLKWSGDKMDIEERLACLVGSCSGHDGRSASLTAPNGPAQQDAIRRSMRMAGVDPSLISVCECHGTGTALGDPIEIGSLQGVMRGLRKYPLLNTSAKTNISHLEGGAGMAGVMKCVMMVLHSAGPPNCHLRTVNPNLITEGYPVFFQQELCDTTFSTTFIGVSSFGFGGTNSRADVYGRCLRGARKTGNIWTPDRIEQRCLAYASGCRGMYKGYDKLDERMVPAVPISIIGSWDNWATAAEMDCVEPGHFTYRLILGESQKEQFQLIVGNDYSQRLHPGLHQSDFSGLIVGPDSNTDRAGGKSWQIDRTSDAMPAGTAYQITFKWQGEKSIVWKPETVLSIADTSTTGDRYFICGSWNRFAPVEMCMADATGLYEAEITIPEGGAKFQFLRHNDRAQMIYPSEWGSACGPDHGGHYKYFEAFGSFGETMKVQLITKNEQIEVKVVSSNGEQSSWISDPKMSFYVSGSFNDWKYSKLYEDTLIRGLFKCHVSVPQDDPWVGYKILVGTGGSAELQGLSAVVPGSDPEVIDAQRDFKGQEGSFWEILVDVNQDDPSRVIYHRLATHTEMHAIPK